MQNRSGKRTTVRTGITWVWLLVAIPVFGFCGFLLLPKSEQNRLESVDQLLTHRVSRGDLIVSVVEQGTLESTENTEIKCKVRGENTVIWVVENGAIVKEGDKLVRLDTLQIEDQINERSKYALWSLSGAENARANAKRAELAIKEYEEGRFVVQLKTLEKDLAIAESNLRTAKNMLQHASQMFERGYVSQLEVDEKTFAVTQAELAVEGKQTEIEALTEYTKQQQLEQLIGDLKAAEANRDSLNERAKMDGTRRDQALAELEHCTIVAPKDGMVIYPSAQSWERTPDIEEGATVYRDQTLLLIPDLTNMQIKVGIHESIVDQVSKGMRANVSLPESNLEGEVSDIATVAQPAGWWTGNLVKYDTIVNLPETSGLRPGMSAEVEIFLAEHFDVLTVPLAAILQTENENLCWVLTEDKRIERRVVELGDNNNIQIVVESGLEVGEQVILNPRGSLDEARQLSLKTIQENVDELDQGNGQTEKKSNKKPDSASKTSLDESDS